MKNGHITKKSLWRIPPKNTHSESREMIRFPIPQRNTSLFIQTYGPSSSPVSCSKRSFDSCGVNGYMPHRMHIDAAMKLLSYSQQFSVSFCSQQLIMINSRPTFELPISKRGKWWPLPFPWPSYCKRKAVHYYSYTNHSYTKLDRIACATVTLELQV